MMRAALVVLVLAPFAAAPSSAQLKRDLELNLLLGLPQGEFGERSDAGVGANMHFGLRSPRSPLSFGFNLGYSIYGLERRKEPFSTTIPDVTVDVETENSIVLGHLVLRAQVPGDGALVPYVNGLFGFKYLFTQTRIESSRTLDDVATSTNFDDWALSYGAGAGVKIRLSQGEKRTWFLNVAVDYLIGKKAEYLTKGSIRRENGKVVYDVEESDTNVLVPRLGVAFTL